MKFLTQFLKIFIVDISFIGILYFSSGYEAIQMNGTLKLLILFFFSLTIYFFSNSSSPILPILKSSKFYILIILIILTFLFNLDFLKETMILLISLFIAFFVILSMSFYDFIKHYKRIMLFLSIYSLLVFYLALNYPDFIRLFPPSYEREFFEVYNLGFAFINLASSQVRNMSFFWEPGAFQTFLLISIIFETFFGKPSLINLIIFYFTLLTTLSTAGILVGLLLLFTSLFTLIIKKNLNALVLIILPFSLITLYIIYQFLPYNLQYSFFGKILSIFGNNVDFTAQVRIDSIILPLERFIKNPLNYFFGIGFNNLKQSVILQGHDMTTNTPVNWIVGYGIFFFSIILNWIYKLVKTIPYSRFIKSMVFLIFLLSLSSQNYLWNVPIYSIIMISNKIK